MVIEKDERYNELLNILKNSPSNSVNEELEEFIKDYKICGLTIVPDQHRENIITIINILHNKLMYNPKSWKGLVLSRNVFNDERFKSHPLYDECFILSFLQGKWDFLQDCCDKSTVLENAHLIPNVEYNNHDIKIINNYFEINKYDIKKNKHLYGIMLKANPELASSLTSDHENDIAFISDIATSRPEIVKYLSSGHPVLSSEEIMTKAIIADPSLYLKAGKNIQSNRELVEKVIESNPNLVHLLSNNYSNLPTSIQEIPKVKECYLNLSSAPHPSSLPKEQRYTKQDIEKFLALIKKDPTLVRKTVFANDSKIMLKLIAKDYQIFNHASETLKKDLKFVCLAVKTNYKIASLLPPSSLKEPKLMLLLSKMDPRAYEFADTKLKESKKFREEYNKILNAHNTKKAEANENSSSSSTNE